MKKAFLKGITSFIAAALLLGMLAGCGKSENSASAESGTASATQSAASTGTAPTGEKISFKATTVSFGEEPTGKPGQEAWLNKSEELMGKPLDIEFEYIHMQDYTDKFKIMLASNDLPDIATVWGLNQDEVVRYGQNGTFLELSQYIDKMSNYKKYLDLSPSTKVKLYSPDGKLYAAYAATANILEVDGGHDISHSVGIRKDVFDKNNIAVPTTVDELYQAAKKLKAIYPKKYPIFQMEEWSNPINLLCATNHIPNNLPNQNGEGRYYDGSKFAYAPITENYKDALIEMKRWYKEGLISPDYFTQTQANGNATLAAGDGFIVPSMWYGYPAEWEIKYPDQKWVMVTGIQNPKYGKPWEFGTYTTDMASVIPNWSTVINPSSKLVDDMVKFIDIQFSDDIMNTVAWGVEGTTYTVGSDGKKKFNDEILKDPSTSMAKYGIGTGTCRSGIFPQIQDALANAQLVKEQNNIVDGKEVRATYNVIKKNMHHSGTSCYKTLNTCKTACFHCISYSRLTCPTKR